MINWKKVEIVLEDYYICDVTKDSLFHLSDTADYGFYLIDDNYINFFDYREVDFYSKDLTIELGENGKDYVQLIPDNFSVLIDYLFEYNLLDLYDYSSREEVKNFLLKQYNDGR